MCGKLFVVMSMAAIAASLLCSGLAFAQPGAGTGPEVVPAPAPQAAQPQDRPKARYDPIRAAEDAMRTADEAARAAVNRQLEMVADARYYGPWNPTAYRVAVPYVAPWVPPRVARRLPYGAYVVPPVPFLAWPGRIPVPIPQPLGHEKTWTGPNGYIYRPFFEPPRTTWTVPVPAAPQVPTPPRPPASDALPPAAGPALIEPPVGPEPIPTPPADPAPREF